MEEAPENGKESSHSANANGMNELATTCIKHILTETSSHMDNRKKRKIYSLSNELFLKKNMFAIKLATKNTQK
jgi:hypothetical protein